MRGVEECARDAELGGGCKARLAAAQHNGPAGGAPASHESLAFSVHYFSNQAHGAVVCNVTRGCSLQPTGLHDCVGLQAHRLALRGNRPRVIASGA